MHQEPESQVLPGQGRDVGAQTLAGAQPGQHVARQLGSQDIVHGEHHSALAVHGPRPRFGDVVEQNAEPERLTARQLVRERLRQGGHRRHMVAERRPAGQGLPARR